MGSTWERIRALLGALGATSGRSKTNLTGYKLDTFETFLAYAPLGITWERIGDLLGALGAI